MVYKVDL